MQQLIELNLYIVVLLFCCKCLFSITEIKSIKVCGSATEGCGLKGMFYEVKSNY